MLLTWNIVLYIIPIVLVQYYSIQIIILLCRKGTSSDVKGSLLQRHFLFLVLQNFYSYFSFLFWKVTKSDKSGGSYSFIFDLIGLFIALVRFFEPYVLYSFIQDINSLGLCKLKWIFSNKKYTKQALCSFTCSILNVEYVYLILIGVE